MSRRLGGSGASPSTKALAEASLLSLCGRRELRDISRCATALSVPPGEAIVREGEPADRFFLIEAGTARVTVSDRTVALLGEGDFFGELGLVDDRPRSATVTAETSMRLHAFSGEDFSRLVDASPTVAARIAKAMSDRLRALEGAPTYAWNRY